MPDEYEIRANFDSTTIVVYQAYPLAIAAPALERGRFVAPFSFNRMTWIKPSFLWMMHRSNWAQKGGQECILAVRITRESWEKALSLAVLTWFHSAAHASYNAWKEAMAAAPVNIQWDPERSLRGGALPHRSIQVGISRHLIREYAEQWITGIEDVTPTVAKIRSLLRAGDSTAAARQLPVERPCPLPAGFGHNILLS